MTAADVVSRFAGDELDRLKWLVLREFRVLPGSKEAKELSDEDFLFCGAHMVLDLSPCPKRLPHDGGENEAFDIKRFNALLEERE